MNQKKFFGGASLEVSTAALRIKEAKTLSVLHSKHTANYTCYVVFT